MEVHQLSIVDNSGTILVSENALLKLTDWPSSIKNKYMLPSIKFLTARLVLIHDGTNLYLVESGTREEFSFGNWTIMSSIRLESHVKKACYLDDAVINPETESINCAFVCVESNENSKANSTVCIEWLIFDKIQLNILETHKLASRSIPDHVSFESDAKSLNILSDHILGDESSPVEKNSAESAVNKVLWNQILPSHSSNDGVIHIVLQFEGSRFDETKLQNFDFRIFMDSCEHQKMIVSHKHGTGNKISVFNEDLYGRVEKKVSAEFDSNKKQLKFTITPCEPHSTWPHLFRLEFSQMHRTYELEMHPEEAFHKPNKEQTNEAVYEESEGTPFEGFNLQQYESIDLNEETGAEDLLMLRYKIEKSVVTLSQLMRLDGQRWLLNCSLGYNMGATKACCLRFDVDGIILAGNDKDWMRHVGTLQAFGFVLASKEQHRFVAAPSIHRLEELETKSTRVQFVAVADYSKRIYIYCQPTPENNDPDCKVRKRMKHTQNGDTVAEFSDIVHTAWQHVVTLDSDEEIIGFSAIDNPRSGCIVLTKTKSFFVELPNN
ncbi:NudC domain-containing protein 1 [Cichlidogyrus casuarinus]|uniref:NudC domain-containing protein 1 n=1 Tax=Cichlidogyrus casuarinus TaxID=1844966 RepID=A0ABD2QG70_9PLAT